MHFVAAAAERSRVLGKEGGLIPLDQLMKINQINFDDFDFVTLTNI